MSLNSCQIMGNLTRDPELRYTQSGKGVCALSIANNRVYTKNGEKVQEVSYFDVDVWGPMGENCSKYLTKGSGVVIEGRLRQDRWEKDGKTQSKVRITASSVHFLPKRGNEGGGGGYDRQPAGANAANDTHSPAASDTFQSPDSVAWDD